jgi:cell division protein FtsB
MSTTLLVAAAVVAAAACPLHMWWQQRRGRRAACGMPVRRAASENDVVALRARQQELAAQIAELEGHEPTPTHDARSRQ